MPHDRYGYLHQISADPLVMVRPEMVTVSPRSDVKYGTLAIAIHCKVLSARS